MSPELAGSLTPLLELAREGLWEGFVVFLRVGAVLALMPLFGEMAIPARVRLALGLAFTMIALPAVAGTLPFPDAPAQIFLLLAGEVVTGLVFGFGLRLFVLALQTAGAMAAQATSLSQLFGGGPGAEPSPAMSHVLVVGGLALAGLLGLPAQAAAYILQSYELVPPGAFLDPAMLLQMSLAEIGRAFGLAFSLAAPFVMAALLYNLVLGIINRAMPQLMVTFIGAPALTAGGLALFVLAAPVMLAAWVAALQAFLADPFGGVP